MTRHKAIKNLKHYQRWRMGEDDDLPMPEPKDITQAINLAIVFMENQSKAISEIENAMESYYLVSSNESETIEKINQSLLLIGLLTWHNKK